MIELLARSTSKALAVAELQREFGGRHVVFVGDDRTDEEVFRAIGDDGCSIRVGGGRPPPATAWPARQRSSSSSTPSPPPLIIECFR